MFRWEGKPGGAGFACCFVIDRIGRIKGRNDFSHGEFPMRLLITGASGQLGAYLLHELRSKDVDVVAWSGSRSEPLFDVAMRPVNLAEPEQIAKAFRETRPECVIHAGAITTVDGCFRSPDEARRVNTEATAQLADLAAALGARLVFVSTDLVFDGEKGGYREEDAAAPLSVYGRSKLAGEQAVLSHGRSVVARVSLLFGPALIARPSFFDMQVKALQTGSAVTLFSDEWRTPLSLVAAAQNVLALAFSDFTGLLHLGGPERLSRVEMGQQIASFLGADASVIAPTQRACAAPAEPRPRDVSLDSTRWRQLFPHQPWPTWTEALSRLGMVTRISWFDC
jgi:dTDP-4-dehydrorhamnose reductase